MPRMFAVVPLLVLALSLPGKAIAGPPEGVSGKMVLDEVADGLRKYRKEKDAVKRLRLLERLATTRDPRVAIVLVEARPSASETGSGGDPAGLITSSRALGFTPGTPSGWTAGGRRTRLTCAAAPSNSRSSRTCPERNPMKLSRASSYAIAALAYLAREKPDAPVPSTRCARAEGIPERFLLKILRPLVNAGILRSVRGPTVATAWPAAEGRHPAGSRRGRGRAAPGRRGPVGEGRSGPRQAVAGRVRRGAGAGARAAGEGDAGGVGAGEVNAVASCHPGGVLIVGRQTRPPGRRLTRD